MTGSIATSVVPLTFLSRLVECAAILMNRYSVGHDGKTPYERLKGNNTNMFGFEFGETVLFRRVPVPSKLAKWDSLWNVGCRFTIGECMVEVSDDSQKKSDGAAKRYCS